MKAFDAKKYLSKAEENQYIEKHGQRSAKKMQKYRAAVSELIKLITEIQETDEQQKEIRRKRRQFLKKTAPFVLLAFSLLASAIVLWTQKHFYSAFTLSIISLVIGSAQRVYTRTHPKPFFSGSGIIWMRKTLPRSSIVHRFSCFLDQNIFLLCVITCILLAVFSLICNDLITAILLVILICDQLTCHIIILRYWKKHPYLIDYSDYRNTER